MSASLNEAHPVRLSVIIDGRLDRVRAWQVATIAGRLGLAGVWLRQPWWPLTAPGMSEMDGADLLTELSSGLQVPPGIIVDADAADTSWLNRLGTLHRVALTGTPTAVERWQNLIGRRQDPTVAQLALPRPPDGDGEPYALFVPCAPGRDLAAEVSAAVAAAGGRPVLAEVTVSVGRTVAEARARADMDDLIKLVGHPAQQGLFGTLEECQAAAARLGHAGVTELVCYLPLASDLLDVLAQVRSIAIGACVLRPGEPPSAAPPPPAGWGGRRTRR